MGRFNRPSYEAQYEIPIAFNSVFLALKKGKYVVSLFDSNFTFSQDLHLAAAREQPNLASNVKVSKEMDQSGTELGSEGRKIHLNVKIGASVKDIRDEFENMHPGESISHEIIECVIGAFQRSCDETVQCSSSDEDEESAAGGQDPEASDLGNFSYFLHIAATEHLWMVVRAL
ncbi:unnamed protein product [Darwinula stevensoni]|uniref:Uncharacterized protein n=1 Tax=Darwinula stevensoni TaxID=69355 RepID=A0A7R8X4Y9_9CRUS|nr:unnamed protein product [Darwinula stevensoni]CAG0886565.1 unnamed protein product [Darwinula stevensoni]